MNVGLVLETRHEARPRRRLPGIDDLIHEGMRMRKPDRQRSSRVSGSVDEVILMHDDAAASTHACSHLTLM